MRYLFLLTSVLLMFGFFTDVFSQSFKNLTLEDLYKVHDENSFKYAMLINGFGHHFQKGDEVVYEYKDEYFLKSIWNTKRQTMLFSYSTGNFMRFFL